MVNSKVLFQEFLNHLPANGNADEKRSIAYLVFKKIAGISPTEILAEKEIDVTGSQHQKLVEAAQRLKIHEPVQYILEEAAFFGRTFFVNRQVLIPRPETEELVMLVKKLIGTQSNQAVRLLDIGTGSGCIPVTLALELPQAQVFATDISAPALAVAEENASRWKAHVNFIQHDVLTGTLPVKDLDLIVSNPPYIAHEEKKQMEKNVIDYEPHLALFVPNDDPLKFYKAIGRAAKNVLKAGASLVVEINEQYGKAVADVFNDSGYCAIKIHRDLSGKERMVSCISE